MGPMLEGKLTIITGAARGIGEAAALLFASEGARLVLTDRDEGPLQEVVSRIRSMGGEAIAVPGDVSAERFPDALVRSAVDRFGSDIRVIVNNAGYTWDGVLHKMTDDQWEAMLKVHCTAPFRILRAAAPYIQENARREVETGTRVMRKIVNVSSASGTHGSAGQANYATAKAGIVGLTKTLAREWGWINVNVNAVAFGWIETRLTQPKEEAAPLRTEAGDIALGVPKAKLQAFRAAIPLGRPGTPDEAARALLFLASPLSDYVSGHVLEVTGGL